MPEKPHDGGPAFPPGAALIEASKAQDQELAEACMGMSLRDYLAAHALQGILANPNWNACALEKNRVDVSRADELAAAASLAYADALLKAREGR
jgi:hypothetical protein